MFTWPSSGCQSWPESQIGTGLASEASLRWPRKKEKKLYGMNPQQNFRLFLTMEFNPRTCAFGFSNRRPGALCNALAQDSGEPHPVVEGLRLRATVGSWRLRSSREAPGLPPPTPTLVLRRGARLFAALLCASAAAGAHGPAARGTLQARPRSLGASEPRSLGLGCDLRRLHFLLAFLHAVVLERLRFFPVGFRTRSLSSVARKLQARLEQEIRVQRRRSNLWPQPFLAELY